MDFNICKCAILLITKKCNTGFFYHTILCSTLERVDNREYPGVSISHDLCWDKHCNQITKKASKTLGLLHHTPSPCSKEVKSRAYQTLVQPQLEYAAEAWNPYNITTADRLEHILCAAARYGHHDYRRTTRLNNLINILGWDRLHTRRLVSQLTMSYKIHYHLVNIQISQLISPATFTGIHDHLLKYAIPLATIDSYKFSLFPCSIRLWNQLPSTAVYAALPAAFQAITLPAIIEMKLLIGSKMLQLISSFSSPIPVTVRLYQIPSVALMELI